MKCPIVFVACFLIVLMCNCDYAHSKIWALLAAGSSGYENYRHQADICHAYQILKKNGIPEENIIVMMADDIANNSMNPTPGIIINEPNGPDVYKGVKKDYVGDHVTGKNFLNILQGNETAMDGTGTGRVIKSESDDIIFVNFVDHGSPGALCFVDDDLYTPDLIKVLQMMSKEKKFKKMVLYVEACFSGSLFDDKLADDLDIFVMTAADPNESSYACYYDDQRGTYLGDVFSVNWMEKAEQNPFALKSLHHLFEKVRTNTTQSHVEEYGDLDIGNTKLSFIINSPPKAYYKKDRPNVEMDTVKSEDVPLAILEHKLRKANQENDLKSISLYMKQMRSILNERKIIDKVVNTILRTIAKGDEHTVRKLKRMITSINRNNMHCCAELSKAFSESCFKIKDPYVGKAISPLLNTCNFGNFNVAEVIDSMKFICSDDVKSLYSSLSWSK